MVPSAPVCLWLLSALGPQPWEGAATRSWVVGRGRAVLVSWEEVGWVQCSPVRQGLQSWLDALRMLLVLWAFEQPPLNAQSLVM